MAGAAGAAYYNLWAMSDRYRAIAAVAGFAWVAAWGAYMASGAPLSGDIFATIVILAGAAWSYALWPWRPGPRAEFPTHERPPSHERMPLVGPTMRGVRKVGLVVLVALVGGVVAVALSLALESSGWYFEDVYERPAQDQQRAPAPTR